MKTKNPYPTHLSSAAIGWDEGYAAGLLAGERRLARALRRFVNQHQVTLGDSEWKEMIWSWLSARLKRGKR